MSLAWIEAPSRKFQAIASSKTGLPCMFWVTRVEAVTKQLLCARPGPGAAQQLVDVVDVERRHGEVQRLGLGSTRQRGTPGGRIAPPATSHHIQRVPTGGTPAPTVENFRGLWQYLPQQATC